MTATVWLPVSFTGSVEGQSLMLRRINDRKRDRRVGHLGSRVEHAQAHASGKETFERNVKLAFGDEIVANRIREPEIRGATVCIGSRFNAGNRTGLLIGRVMVTVLLGEVVDRI